MAHDPDDPWALSWYGLALSEQDAHPSAEEHARRAVELRPDHSALLTNLAMVLLAMDEPEKRKEAERTLEKAVANAPAGFHGPRSMLEDLRNDGGPALDGENQLKEEGEEGGSRSES